ncbi:hypothetical protein [Solitalea canadensis]|uniref:Uncharacterized protein n=1 Tax=Solitalea canadensis (strain ATCC 29591 / DSM 3403 / JCM 21819 / LMG 8368 / NBRC 15130 / NCIMB 12057 / USAM 9D) TaxID=929556 RepID=H8KPB3_SOLCM|nr:hypothetical protein [Solitalea canadensis]AFD05811.1 hypothetical protein Solca_0686 [Solitalea canadensis DSM 3403]
MKSIALFAFLLLTTFTVFSQTVEQAQENLNTLIEQRSILFQEWKKNKDERNAFFGGQSKNDLRQIIETQQRIIEMDNKVMDAIERLNMARSSSIVQKRDSLSGQTFRFNSEQERMKNLITQKENKIKSLNSEIAYHERTENIYKIAFLLSLTALVGIIIFFWYKR